MSTTYIQNPDSGLLLDSVVQVPPPPTPVLNATGVEWSIVGQSNIYYFQSPLETSTPYSVFTSLSYNGGTPYMDTYASANSVMYAVQDGSGNWTICPFGSTLGTPLYLSCDSSGNLSFTSTLNDSARWIRASDGVNYKIHNKNYSTLYLQAMSNGHIVQASAYNGSFANQYDWAMPSAPLCNIAYYDGTNTWYLQFTLPSSYPISCYLTSSPSDISYYWVKRSNGSNFTFENMGNPGSLLTADATDGIPIGNTTFTYSDQASVSQVWSL